MFTKNSWNSMKGKGYQMLEFSLKISSSVNAIGDIQYRFWVF